MNRPRVLILWALVAAAVGPVMAEVVEIEAARDNTLYQDDLGSTSNGSGAQLFAGTTLAAEVRRALLAFDVAAAVPAGAIIESVSLTLTMNKTIAPAHPVSLHRVLADWGQGASDASGEEGFGAVAETGDATWLHGFFPGASWTSPGGDFEPAPSATISVGIQGPYSWTSPQMAADVQAWLDRPSTDFGWAIVGDEATFPTAKRFASSENPALATRPVLTVEFSPGGADVPASSAAGAAVAAALSMLAGALLLRRRRTGA